MLHDKPRRSTRPVVTEHSVPGNTPVQNTRVSPSNEGEYRNSPDLSTGKHSSLNPSEQIPPDAQEICSAQREPATKKGHKTPVPDTLRFHALHMHPDIVAALKVLGPNAYDMLRRQTCDIIRVLDIAHQSLDDGDLWDPLYSIDYALFALYEIPKDIVAQERGFEGNTYGAIGIIAKDFDVNPKTVERHSKVLDTRVTKVFLSRLIHELDAIAEWGHVSTIVLLLENLADVS